MAVRSSKFKGGGGTPLSLKFDGGVNYAQSPAFVADNELTRAFNYIYNNQSNRPEGRPGTYCVTATNLANPIRKLYYYEKSASVKYLVCASGGHLYYLDDDAWVEIGDLTDTTTVPSFITFNSKLLIADGGTHIRTWDGTTYTTLATSPQATALCIIKNRVVANTTAEPDSVYFSTTNDETDWNTGGSAVGLKAGYGDNMSVNGFAVFGDDLIVSKKGDSLKRLYRVNVADATPSSWYVAILSTNNCSQNAHTIVGAFNNVFFVDGNGFKSLKGVTEYGDLQVDLVGSKINTTFVSGVSCDEVAYLPAFTAIWFCLADKTFAYHRIVDGDGKLHHAFTDMAFKQGRIMSICQAGEIVYLAGYNGYLYKLDDSLATDETAPDVEENYVTILTSKQFPFSSEVIAKWTQLQLAPLNEGEAILTANTFTGTTAIMSITLRALGDPLYEATEYLYGATETLFSSATEAWIEKTYNRVRGKSIQFDLQTSSGRVGVDGLKTEFVLVGV